MASSAADDAAGDGAAVTDGAAAALGGVCSTARGGKLARVRKASSGLLVRLPQSAICFFQVVNCPSEHGSVRFHLLLATDKSDPTGTAKQLGSARHIALVHSLHR